MRYNNYNCFVIFEVLIHVGLSKRCLINDVNLKLHTARLKLDRLVLRDVDFLRRMLNMFFA